MKKNTHNKYLKVCIISDCFIPRKISAAGMLYNLSNALAQKNIEVICLFGSVKTDDLKYKNNKLKNYDLTNIKIISSSFMSSLRDGKYYLRFIFEIILAFSLSLKAIRYRKSFDDLDLIICYSPSAFLWMPSLVLKIITGSPVYLILRDIFPDWLVNIGIIKNKILIKFLKLITYPQFIIPNVIGCESKKDTNLVKKIIKNKTVETLYNWPSLKDNLTKGFNVDQLGYIKFYKNNKNNKNIFSVYTGNDSISHDLNSGLNFLRLFFKKTNIGIELIINRFASKIKSTSIKTNLIEKKWDMVPNYFLPHIYKYADFGIVSLNVKHETNNLPGKFVSYIQFGLPIICFANSKSELANMIRRSNCGCVIDITNKTEYNNKLLLKFLLDFNKNKKKYSKNSLKLFNDNFSLDAAVKILNNKKNIFRA